VVQSAIRCRATTSVAGVPPARLDFGVFVNLFFQCLCVCFQAGVCSFFLFSFFCFGFSGSHYLFLFLLSLLFNFHFQSILFLLCLLFSVYNVVVSWLLNCVLLVVVFVGVGVSDPPPYLFLLVFSVRSLSGCLS
jgi:hypothetical protein